MTPWVLLLAQQSDMAATAEKSTAAGGPGWVVAVNLVIWTGIFLYLMRLDRRAGRKEQER